MSTSRPWPEGPAHPHLGDRDADVWVARLDLAPVQLEMLRGTLSEDERIRAGRFAQAERRERSVAAHGILRDILARYCACSPNAIAFAVNPHGKPFLAASLENDSLRFNLSHSGDCVLYAVANGPEVGVDIETIRERAGLLKIAERFFAPQEAAALREMPAARQTDAFHACWTRKEAVVKALGQGLSFSIDAFEVSVEPAARSVQLHTMLAPEDRRRWTLIDATPCDGYAAALAIENPVGDVRFWRWTPPAA